MTLENGDGKVIQVVLIDEAGTGNLGFSSKPQ